MKKLLFVAAIVGLGTVYASPALATLCATPWFWGTWHCSINGKAGKMSWIVADDGCELTGDVFDGENWAFSFPVGRYGSDSLTFSIDGAETYLKLDRTRTRISGYTRWRGGIRGSRPMTCVRR